MENNKMRISEIERNTNETKIKIKLNIDGTGKYKNDTHIGFLDHMLDLFARHGRFDLETICYGDINVDYHHSVEDMGIVLGKCFAKALGDLKGIKRYGNFSMPMCEALTIVSVDICGRSHLIFNSDLKHEKVGDFDTELVKEFFTAFTNSMNITLHINTLYGENTHHIIESIFKGAARALAQACEIDEKYKDEVLSTKGMLENNKN
ncbi:imidazoleglycerol-phosphate dehydratase HisB [Brachyspira hyodysenteriae]|uniref:imidazoleglycerol-phosphate dehydratase HisB n=1 Tax=Brachyspira hyodysenteriae TaxID=159 RepID=UPI0009BBC8D7|nr:imidazoleglycerol-phosphate dehydratase HisB [Brachyspira hyodysenteriae]QTM08451.1 imidazoleglycerol-phosphate dehydratase HisB [Brachyspira hyodysenteriae]